MAQQTALAQSRGSEAYNFDLFVAQPKPRPAQPKLRVAHNQRRRIQAQTKRMLRVLLMVVLIAVLGVAVVDTYARVGELRTQINAKETELTVLEATYTDLVFQLESKTNLNKVEEQARQLGLVKIDKSQVTYIRVLDENTIEVQSSPWSNLISTLSGNNAPVEEDETGGDTTEE